MDYYWCDAQRKLVSQFTIWDYLGVPDERSNANQEGNSVGFSDGVCLEHSGTGLTYYDARCTKN